MGFYEQGGGGKPETQWLNFMDELDVRCGLDGQKCLKVETQTTLSSKLAAFKLIEQGIQLGLFTVDIGQYQYPISIKSPQ
jgi:hypothetical protein